MILNKDYFNKISPPDFILSKADGTKTGNIICTEQKINIEFNAPNEASFKTPLYMDNILNPVYAEITEGKFIYVENIGIFVIQNIDIESDGHDSETKTVTSKSMEILLGQKYLELFTINMGTTESLDSVSFYHAANPALSLLDLVLEKCPDWHIGYVAPSLCDMQRSFEVTRQDIYSFLTADVSQAFGCIFVFDTLHMTINVYLENEIGEDTDIYITYNNLLKNTSMSYSIDDIKTCLTVLGSDDLNLREINMGYDKIYNLDFFHSKEYMSDSLYDAYLSWKNKRIGNVDRYTELLSEYQSYYDDLNYELNLKMPSDPTSTNWEEYGLIPLQEKKAEYEQRLAVMMKAGWGNPEHDNYSAVYLPDYETLQNILKQISEEKKEISAIESLQKDIKNQMDDIIELVDMTKSFTSDQLSELTKFIREDELSSSNYVVTDSMTQSEKIRMLQSLLDYGKDELNKLSQPQIQFSASLINLFALKEFDKISDTFDIGNYVHIILRDDYTVKARILKIELDFLNEAEITVTFGNVNRLKDKQIFTDVSKALKTANNVSTSVSFNSSYWNKANQEAASLSSLIESGLLGQGKQLSSGDGSQLVIDNRGIFLNTTSGEYAGKDSIFLGGGKILFTSDNWKTVSMSMGRVDLTIGGKPKSVFGSISDVVLGGYIVGSTIDGTTINVGGNGSDGKIVMYDKDGKEAGKWDKSGLVLPSNTTITWTNVTDTEHIATKEETVPIDEISSHLSSEADSVTIGDNRMSILSDHFKLQGSGEVDATGIFKSSRTCGNGATYGASLSGSCFTVSKNDSPIGVIGSVPDADFLVGEAFLLAAGTEAKALALGLPSKSNPDGYTAHYYLNNGLNPLERTERHIFDGDMYVSGNVRANGSLSVNGDIQCTGAKNRLVSTQSYGTVAMNALETPEACFSDFGSGTILSGGECRIDFHPVFAETIDLTSAYYVLITPTNEKQISFTEKGCGYFIVHGENGASFDWMITCRQKQ